MSIRKYFLPLLCPEIDVKFAQLYGNFTLIAPATLKETIQIVVSRSGRPSLAGYYLADVISPTLLIVGNINGDVIKFNKIRGLKPNGTKTYAKTKH